MYNHIYLYIQNIIPDVITLIKLIDMPRACNIKAYHSRFAAHSVKSPRLVTSFNSMWCTEMHLSMPKSSCGNDEYTDVSLKSFCDICY